MKKLPWCWGDICWIAKTLGGSRMQVLGRDRAQVYRRHGRQHQLRFAVRLQWRRLWLFPNWTWPGWSCLAQPSRREWHSTGLQKDAQNLRHQLWLAEVRLSKAYLENCMLGHQHKNLSNKRIQVNKSWLDVNTLGRESFSLVNRVLNHVRGYTPRLGMARSRRNQRIIFGVNIGFGDWIPAKIFWQQKSNICCFFSQKRVFWGF